MSEATVRTLAVIGLASLATVGLVLLYIGFFKVLGLLGERLSGLLNTNERVSKAVTTIGIGALIASGLFVAYRVVVRGLEAYYDYIRSAEKDDLRSRRGQFRDRCAEERAIRGIHSTESCDEAAIRVVR